MGNFYIGDSNSKARAITNAYVGVDGKARKIKQIYVGDSNNIARLVWSATNKKKYLFFGIRAEDTSNYGKKVPVCSVTKGEPSTVTNFYNINQTGYGASKYLYDGARPNINDASVIVHTGEGRRYLYFIKEVNGTYQDWFNITVNDIPSLTPNSGNTVIYHKTYYSVSHELMDYQLSADGKILYCAIHTKSRDTSTDSYYSYRTVILFFDISSGSLVYKNSIMYQNDSYYTDYSYYCASFGMTANDDVTVIAVAAHYYSYQSGTYYHTHKCAGYFGDVNGTYSFASLPSYYTDSTNYLWAYGLERPKISPDGKYISYMTTSKNNPSETATYDKRIVCATINKDSKNFSLINMFGSGYWDIIHADISCMDWIDEKHFLVMQNSTSIYNEGTVDFKLYKVENGTITKLSDFEMQEGSTPINPYTQYTNGNGNSVTYSNVEDIAIDLVNNKMIWIRGSGMYYICSLTGSNGTYTGFTVDSSFSSYSVYPNSRISSVIWQTKE